MTPLAGPFYAFALLLGVAGALKLHDPRGTSGALAAAGLPRSFALVRGLGGVEVLIAAGAIWTGRPLFAGLLAAAYVTFAGFAGLALVRDLPVASCGCFGKADTPPSRTHIGITLVGAITSGWVAVAQIGPVSRILADQPWAGLPFVAATLVAAYLLYVALTLLARSASIVAGRQGSLGSMQTTRVAE